MIINGQNIGKLTYNGIEINKVLYNNLVVFKKITQPVSNVIYFNDFNADDNITIGDGWVNLIGTMGIQNGKAYVSSASGRTALAVKDVGISDCVLSVEVIIGNQDGIAFRVVDDKNYYFARITFNGLLQVYRMLAGSATLLGEYSVGTINGGTYKMIIKLQGDSLTIGLDDKESLVTTTTSYFNNATSHGMRSYSSGSTYGNYDNFEVKTVL